MGNPDQLAFCLINPYTIYKSRTGGVIARLFTRTALELVAARMFAPSKELAEEYAATVVSARNPSDRRIQELIRQYVLDHYAPDPKTGQRRRVMLLVFRGEDANKRLRAAVGQVDPGKGPAGETIRDTYGDYVVAPDGSVRYFEPAVLAAPTNEQVEEKLRIWGRYSASDGGLLQGVIRHPRGTHIEQTLVLLKPDNFRFPSARPGNIVDLISRTGLSIIAVKVHHMTVAEACQFYGPVRQVLLEKLVEPTGDRARNALEKEFGFAIPAAAQQQIAQLLTPPHVEHRFNEIVSFMTGRNPATTPPENVATPGPEKIVALVYEGPDAVAKIRNVLGSTDPRKAAPGTIRRELGQDIMVNAAHASDSPANAKREMDIIRVGEDNFTPLIEQFYNCKL